jgi:hypothetical protein
MSTPTNPRPYRYFLSFTGSNYAGQIFGWQDINLDQPITSGAVIKQVEGWLKETNDLTHVTLLNFQRFDAAGGTELL